MSITQSKRALVFEFREVLYFREFFIQSLNFHNLTSEAIDSVVACSLVAALIKNFCIAAHVDFKYESLNLHNSSIVEWKYKLETLCNWFIRSNQIADKLYFNSFNGDLRVEVKVIGARIILTVDLDQHPTF
jgi:hypothetical protein